MPTNAYITVACLYKYIQYGTLYKHANMYTAMYACMKWLYAHIHCIRFVFGVLFDATVSCYTVRLPT